MMIVSEIWTRSAAPSLPLGLSAEWSCGIEIDSGRFGEGPPNGGSAGWPLAALRAFVRIGGGHSRGRHNIKSRPVRDGKRRAVIFPQDWRWEWAGALYGDTCYTDYPRRDRAGRAPACAAAARIRWSHRSQAACRDAAGCR